MLLTGRNLAKSYGSRLLFAGITLGLNEGERIGLIGANGSGKSTLLRIFAGLEQPDDGELVTKRQLRASYVPQEDSFDDESQSCVDAVADVMDEHLDDHERHLRATIMLDRAGFKDVNQSINALSGGQRKRLAIVRALAREPELLLMDEPTAGVDARLRHEILHLLDDLHERGLAILLTTHDLNGIAAHLPRMVCLNRSVIGAGRPVDVLTPDILERTYGASMQVLEHGGMPVVVDHFEHRHATADGHEHTHVHGHAHGHTHDHTHRDAP